MRPESIDPNISNSLAKNMNVEPGVMKKILGVGMRLKLPFIDEETTYSRLSNTCI